MNDQRGLWSYSILNKTMKLTNWFGQCNGYVLHDNVNKSNCQRNIPSSSHSTIEFVWSNTSTYTTIIMPCYFSCFMFFMSQERYTLVLSPCTWKGLPTSWSWPLIAYRLAVEFRSCLKAALLRNLGYWQTSYTLANASHTMSNKHSRVNLLLPSQYLERSKAVCSTSWVEQLAKIIQLLELKLSATDCIWHLLVILSVADLLDCEYGSWYVHL